MKVTKLKKMQFDQRKKGDDQQSKFDRIVKLCSGQNDGVLLDAGALFLNYAANLNDFHKKISRVGDEALTFGRLKDLFRSTLQRMQKILDAENPYEALIDAARLMSASEESTQTVDEIDSRWLRATAKARRARLNEVARAVVEGSRRKYQKDYDLMKDLELPEDRRVTCSNRALGMFDSHEFIIKIILESSFSTLKGFSEKVKSLGQGKLFAVGMAKFNKLSRWIEQQPLKEREGMLMEAVRDRKNQADERKRRSLDDDQRSLASRPKRFR
jgi:hypothetical protein